MGRFLRGFHQGGPDDISYVARLRFPAYTFIFEWKKIFFRRFFF